MLATVLRTKVASQMSVSTNLIEQRYINNQVLKNTEDIKVLQESLKKFEEKKKVNEIYFNGQIYDAYSRIQDIFKLTNKKLIVVDAYADNTLLNIIKRLNVKVIVITKENNLLTKQDILKYNKQYSNLKVIFNNDFHDRYFIIDEKYVYHCGSSINRIGYKTFSINLINDEEVCTSLINKIENIIY